MLSLSSQIDTGCKLLSYTNRRVSASSTFHSQFTLVHPVSFGNPGRRCRTGQLFYVDDFGNLIPIVNTISVFFPKINTHSGDCALSNSTVLGPGEMEGEEAEAGEGERRTKFEWNLKKIIFKFDKSGPLLATAQNYLLHSSLPLYSLLLTNCEGSHSVRLCYLCQVRFQDFYIMYHGILREKSKISYRVKDNTKISRISLSASERTPSRLITYCNEYSSIAYRSHTRVTFVMSDQNMKM